MFDEVDASGRTIRLEVHGEAVSAACPDCDNVSDRVHSRYMRQLTDLGIGAGSVYPFAYQKSPVTGTTHSYSFTAEAITPPRPPTMSSPRSTSPDVRILRFMA